MSALPRVVEGMEATCLFARPAGGSTWILGSRELDRFLAVPEPTLGVLQRVILLLDGTRTADEVRTRVRDELQRDIDVEEVVRRLDSAGLVARADGSPPPERAGHGLPAIELSSLDLRVPSEWLATRGRGLVGAALALSGLLATALAWWGTMVETLPRPHAGSLPTLVLGMLVCLLLHELAHALAAAREGLRPSSLTASLYLGFLPMLHLRIPGLYTLPPAARVRVWAAGTAANAMLVLVCAAVASGLATGPLGPGWWSALAAWNLAMIQLNLLPFLPTDGYFILATLLREHNIRARAHEVLRHWIRGAAPAVRWCVAIYALGSVAVLGRLLYRLGAWLLYPGGSSHVGVLQFGVVLAVCVLSFVKLRRRRTAVGA